eukprot:TRINITY_DN3443_c0_g1_i1.p1 TRINITY_DN3443_c0_g1~~TRINITY_DN3443_c0_g1_i1.p1  ORF type:complete len:197 (+),score=30.90 TRINITY_DN3443_c0_g1_i1:47-637(+)
MASRVINKLRADNTAFFLCDIQERFRSVITAMPSVVQVAKIMVGSAKVLNIPVFVSEQNPKALGKTVPEIDISNAFKIEKTKFSMLTEELDAEMKRRNNIKNVVLFGIEAHVCVQQTVLGLRERDYNVYLAADGVSSQRQFDRATAFERMRQAGAVVSTSESIIFELLEDAKHIHFKEIQNFFKQTREDPLLISKI